MVKESSTKNAPNLCTQFNLPLKALEEAWIYNHGYTRIVTSHPSNWIFEPPRKIFIEELKDQYVPESAQFKKFIFG